MERTKGYSIVNKTRKTAIYQGFSVERFQNDTSFSSAPRYDHFDTTPHLYSIPFEALRNQYNHNVDGVNIVCYDYLK